MPTISIVERAWVAALAEVLAHRVVAEVELLDERLVDDRHLRRAEGIGARELTALHQRDAHRLEVAGTDGVERRVGVGIGPGLEPFHDQAVAPVVAREHRHQRGDDGGDAGHGRQLVFHPLEQLAGALGGVRVQLGGDAEQHHVIGLEPEIDAADVVEALGEQPGRHQQRHRHRDLHGGERGAEPARGLGAARLTGLVLQGAGQIGPRAVQRGKQAEGEAGAKRRHAGKHQHPSRSARTRSAVRRPQA